MKKLPTLVSILALLAIASLAITWLPVHQVTEPIVGFNEPLVEIPLSVEPVTQVFSATGQSIGGVVLYSRNEHINPHAIQIEVKNVSGKIIGQGRGTSAHVKDGHAAIRVTTNRLTPQPREKISLVITSLSQGDAILATQDSEYTLGEIIASDSHGAKNISFAIIYPTPFTDNAKQGAYLGLALGVALMILHSISSHPRYQTYAWYLAAMMLVMGSLAVSVPLIWSTGIQGISDWDYRFSLNHIYRQTILEYHQVPLWNPYMCGGAAALGDPEFSIFTPTFLSILLLGVLPGYKVALIMSFIITSLGTLVLGKRLSFSPLGASLAALIFTFNGAIILKVVEGHVTILFAYMWLPWVLWSYLAAYQSVSKARVAWLYTLSCATFLLCMLVSGGIYVLSYVLPLFGIVPLFTRQPGRAIRLTTSVLLLFLGLGAFQLLPTLYWVRQFPDPLYVNSTSTLAYLVDIFLQRNLHGAYILPQQLAGWHEYGAYIGYVTLFLALVGMATAPRHRVIRTMLILLPVTILVASSGPVLAPLFDAIPFIPRSNISRVAMLSVAILALMAGWGFTYLQKKNLSTVALCLIAMAIPIDLFSYAHDNLAKTFSLPAVTTPIAPTPYPLAYTNRTFTVRSQGQDYERSYAYTKAGYGTFTFCTVIGPQARVSLFEEKPTRPFAYDKDGNFTVAISNWSPNSFEASYEAQYPSLVTVNGNFAPGWETSVGIVKNRDGQMGLATLPGSHTAVVKYRPPGLRAGIRISLLTLIAAAILIWRPVAIKPPTAYTTSAT
ncbi:MAG: hypothetical protein HYZ63_01720 [Candidatus Andersenbacteria bacterium]|nr:hypothetical protein [Candidatus Andersenbacteria bacterium]